MTERRPRLLFVGAFPPPGRNVFGGHVTACRALLDSTFPQHFELDLIDTTQISNPPPRLPTRIRIAARRFLQFIWRFELRRPEVVLLFVAIGASVVEKGAMAWYARLRGVPAVLFPRGGGLLDSADGSPGFQRYLRAAFGGATMIFCQTPRWQAFAVEALRRPAARAPVIVNWTASSELLAVGRARRPRAQSPVRLLFVGWLERQKGVADLLEALAGLGSTRDFMIDFVGDGSMSAEAAAMAARHGLADRARFLGWQSGSALSAAFARADVFVLPSWEEGLPNAMIEAFAAKLAVVVTSVGGIPDVARDGENALVVPPRAVAALRTAIAQVIDDYSSRARLSEAGFAMAESTFGVEAAVTKLVAGLNSAMAGP